MQSQIPTIKDIEAARRRIDGVARRTPLERSRWLSQDSTILLKLECFQITGSFKIRGAMSKISALSQEEKDRGILAVSAGNHGLGVAHSAELLGVDATIVVPETAAPTKIAAMQRYPVTLLKRGNTYDEAERASREIERETGRTFVSPYNDPLIIAGQGTIGLEIMEDCPDLDAVVVPVGGGGLIAGIAIALKALKPAIKVYGVEPEASPSTTRSLEAGRIIEIHEDETIADGLAGNLEPESITFPIMADLIDEMFLVSEKAIRQSIAAMAREDHIIVEGAGAVGIAALENQRLRGGKTAVIISGRNIGLDKFLNALAGDSD